jgi:hypothetical protein
MGTFDVGAITAQLSLKMDGWNASMRNVQKDVLATKNSMATFTQAIQQSQKSAQDITGHLNTMSQTLLRIEANGKKAGAGVKEGAENAKAGLKDVTTQVDLWGAAMKLVIPIISSLAGGFGIAMMVRSAAMGVNQYDMGLRNLQTSTGLTGTALDSLQTSYSRVMQNTSAQPSTVSDVMATLTQRTTLTGPALEKLANDLARIDEVSKDTGEELAKTLTELTATWDVKPQQISHTLDHLFTTFQKTGTSMSEVANQVANFSPIFQGLGMGMNSAIAFFGALDARGHMATRTLMGLQMGMARLTENAEKLGSSADVSKDLREFVDLVKQLPDAEARALAIDFAGPRAGIQLLKAIKDGLYDSAIEAGKLNDEQDKMRDALGDTDSDISELIDKTETWGQALHKVWNEAVGVMSVLSKPLQFQNLKNLLGFETPEHKVASEKERRRIDAMIPEDIKGTMPRTELPWPPGVSVAEKSAADFATELPWPPGVSLAEKSAADFAAELAPSFAGALGAPPPGPEKWEKLTAAQQRDLERRKAALERKLHPKAGGAEHELPGEKLWENMVPALDIPGLDKTHLLEAGKEIGELKKNLTELAEAGHVGPQVDSLLAVGFWEKIKEWGTENINAVTAALGRAQPAVSKFVQGLAQEAKDLDAARKVVDKAAQEFEAFATGLMSSLEKMDAVHAKLTGSEALKEGHGDISSESAYARYSKESGQWSEGTGAMVSHGLIEQFQGMPDAIQKSRDALKELDPEMAGAYFKEAKKQLDALIEDMRTEFPEAAEVLDQIEEKAFDTKKQQDWAAGFDKIAQTRGGTDARSRAAQRSRAGLQGLMGAASTGVKAFNTDVDEYDAEGNERSSFAVGADKVAKYGETVAQAGNALADTQKKGSGAQKAIASLSDSMQAGADVISGNYVGAVISAVSALGSLMTTAPHLIEGMARVKDEVIKDLGKWSEEITSTIVDTFKTGQIKVGQLANEIITDIANIVVEWEVVEPIMKAMGIPAKYINPQWSGGGGSGVSPSWMGNVFDAGRMVAFAAGGVVMGPHVAPMASFGERGPEAIMPLGRLPGGDLGVKTNGVGASPLNVHINDYRTNGAPVEVNHSVAQDGTRQLELHIRDASTTVGYQGGHDGWMRDRYGIMPVGAV